MTFVSEELKSSHSRSHQTQIKSSTGNSRSVDIPAVPDGITVPTDTVKNLSAAASMVVRDEAVRNKMASISHSARCSTSLCANVYMLYF